MLLASRLALLWVGREGLRLLHFPLVVSTPADSSPMSLLSRHQMAPCFAFGLGGIADIGAMTPASWTLSFLGNAFGSLILSTRPLARGTSSWSWRWPPNEVTPITMGRPI